MEQKGIYRLCHPSSLPWAGIAPTRAGCSEPHPTWLEQAAARCFYTPAWGDTELKVILIQPRAEKHLVARSGADLDSPCGSLQSSLGTSCRDSCWHSTAPGTCNGLRALCTPQENTNSTKHSGKQPEKALLRDLSLIFFPLDYFYRWGNEARSQKWPPATELFSGK